MLGVNRGVGLCELPGGRVRPLPLPLVRVDLSVFVKASASHTGSASEHICSPTIGQRLGYLPPLLNNFSLKDGRGKQG